jgi:EF-hand domain-containing protein 1
MYTQDQYILRYEARLVSKSKDDNVRQFLISFFCGDDTVMVYENSERNSGIWKGKFLERNKLVNPETKDYFKDKDFHVG